VGYAITRKRGDDHRFVRLKNRPTSQEHSAYVDAVDAAFGIDVDYVQLIKMYGEGAAPGGRGVAGRLNLSELLLKQARVMLVRKPQIEGNAGFCRHNLEFR
jgi:hypothetical protein